MKNCKDIENSLPLFAEGLLSNAEKKVAEEHLAECADCSKALADLKKVAAMTQALQEVEPPPWFKQRIMARVREEAEKKSFAQKWFYPLRIKIPIQVMATIVIAIIAVYIYRSGDEQMKAILPPAPQPVMEVQQELAPAEMLKAKKASLPKGRASVVLPWQVPWQERTASAAADDGPLGHTGLSLTGLTYSHADKTHKHTWKAGLSLPAWFDDLTVPLA